MSDFLKGFCEFLGKLMRNARIINVDIEIGVSFVWRDFKASFF